jgi:RNA polymerase sigma-70 factor, ECF subfamily
MVALSYAEPNSLSFDSTRSSAFHTDRTHHADLETFNQLILEHQDAVYRQAYWILGEPEAAEDATQEAFLRAYQNFKSYNGGPFRPWILRITTNYCLDQIRRRKVRQTISLEPFNEYEEEVESPTWLRDPGASVEEMMEREEEEARITNAIRQLPQDYRMAIIMVDVQQLEYREAASVMGVPLGTFKSRLWRGRLELQKRLK